MVIPTYCEEENIESCLKSVKRQEFDKGAIEIIVVDSSSQDATKAIAGKYADKVIDVQERGVSKARNIGAREAKGEFLLFLDADTVLDSKFIAEIHENLVDSNVVCVSGTVAGLERLGLVDRVLESLHYNLMNKVAALSASVGFPFFPTVCCASKRNAFHEIGGFDEDLAIAEDLVFSLRMGRIGKCLVSKRAKAYTSLRRIRKNGHLKNYFVYFRNYFRVFVLNQKPWIQEFPHTREM